MDRLHLDNAWEHHCIDLEDRPVKPPHFGGHIERLIGTMMAPCTCFRARPFRMWLSAETTMRKGARA